MKTFLALLFLLTTLFVYSCGDSSYTAKEANTEMAKVFCGKIFSCEEGKLLRSGDEATCVEKTQEEDNSYSDDCLNYDSNKAYDCVSCLDNLSCSKFFGTTTSFDAECPVCNDVCDE